MRLDERGGLSPRTDKRNGAKRHNPKYSHLFHGAHCIMFRRDGLYHKIGIIKSDYALGPEGTQKLSDLALARFVH